MRCAGATASRRLEPRWWSGAYTVDFLWGHARLVVEVDGYTTHGTRSAFEDDHARDADLAVLGYRVVRFTWRHLVEEPRRVVETLRAVLQPGRAPP